MGDQMADRAVVVPRQRIAVPLRTMIEAPAANKNELREVMEGTEDRRRATADRAARRIAKGADDVPPSSATRGWIRSGSSNG